MRDPGASGMTHPLVAANGTQITGFANRRRKPIGFAADRLRAATAAQSVLSIPACTGAEF
jgi:hypothetical protein